MRRISLPLVDGAAREIGTNVLTPVEQETPTPTPTKDDDERHASALEKDNADSKDRNSSMPARSKKRALSRDLQASVFEGQKGRMFECGQRETGVSPIG